MTPPRTALADWCQQYQICMVSLKYLIDFIFFFYLPQFDSLGNTGGCQASYTVIPPLSTPNCSNITFPPVLDVQATVDNGPMSQFGWIDQVSDQNHSLEALVMVLQVHWHIYYTKKWNGAVHAHCKSFPTCIILDFAINSLTRLLHHYTLLTILLRKIWAA